MLPAATTGAAEDGVLETSPGTIKKRAGAPSRCNSWRMIFSAAALTVRLSIFLLMPATSMRRLDPSTDQAPAPNSCAAVACPASASAEMTARRRASTLGASVIWATVGTFLTGDTSDAAEITSSATAAASAAGAASTGAKDAASCRGSVLRDVLGRSNSATEVAGAVCFIPGSHPLPPEPKGEGETAEGEEGDGLAAGADVLDPEAWGVPRTATPLDTLLSSCSMGSSRCACTSLSKPSSR